MITKRPQQPTTIRTFVIICVALEVVAIMGQLTGFGIQVRNLMIAFGGFWPATLSGRPELYPGQSILMFATSAVLHGSFLHLFMNMVGIMWLGPLVIARVGQGFFLPIMGVSALGAGFAYALLSQDGAPMVGASGVLFGLVGVLGVWDLFDRFHARSELWSFLKQAIALLTLNVAFSLVAGGIVAWQAHLGGFIAGALCGALTWRRSTAR